MNRIREGVEQVFLYVTARCNLRCVTCYSIPELEKNPELNSDGVMTVLRYWRDRGAHKLTFLGGEPTVYRQLRGVTLSARALGYDFVRINTNGVFAPSYLHQPWVRGIDVFCFSIDGHTAEINDSIRRGGKLSVTLSNMDLAKSLTHDVRVNITVTSLNISSLLETMRLAENHGASTVYINVVFLMGNAAENDQLAVAPERWRTAYEEVSRHATNFKMRIKVPIGFVQEHELGTSITEGHRCIAVDQRRQYVQANGDAYPCMLMWGRKDSLVGTLADGSYTSLAPTWPEPERMHRCCAYWPGNPDGWLPLCQFYKTKFNYDDAKCLISATQMRGDDGSI